MCRKRPFSSTYVHYIALVLINLILCVCFVYYRWSLTNVCESSFNDLKYTPKRRWLCWIQFSGCFFIFFKIIFFLNLVKWTKFYETFRSRTFFFVKNDKLTFGKITDFLKFFFNFENFSNIHDRTSIIFEVLEVSL